METFTTLSTILGFITSIVWLFYLLYSHNVTKNILSTRERYIHDLENDLSHINQTHSSLMQSLDSTKSELSIKTYELQNIESALLEKHENANKLWRATEERKIREDANKRQRTTLRGQTLEHIAPITILDQYRIDDFRFVGDPIDYVVFAGASSVSDGQTDEIEGIYFIDIKTGAADLSKVQRRIRDAIKAQKVYFATYNIDKKEFKKW